MSPTSKKTQGEDWSMELKSIYDTFPKLRIYASGSSALEIFKGSHDLSRRTIVYKMQGQSLREYIELTYSINLKSYTLEEILQDHVAIANYIRQKVENENKKILAIFNEYIKFGFYPFYTEQNNDAEYFLLLEQNVNATIESDLVSVYNSLTGNSVRKIKKLISFFISMLQPWHELSAPNHGDFWVDDKYLFEVGGKNNETKQLKGNKQGYLALDNIERGINNKIPLWLFGFIY